ncbi:MAG TPA: TorF family putative porin [Burkholderiales bacterium]|nr:TorF family putative porin [Burkholderiales bacterium]
MRRSFLALSVAAAIGAPALASAQQAATTPPPYTFTGNVSLASEYLYRGIAQTRGKPAIQGGFDFAHSSGFYLGTWGSNISWISDSVPGSSASMEWDVYGGYKGSFAKDFGYDVGALTYIYPGTGFGSFDPNTTEIYGALSWKWLTAKYSYSVTKLFGWVNPTTGEDSKGSGYFDLTGNFDLGSGFTLVAHGGYQDVRHYGDASYTDWKLGATKDLGFGTLGLFYSDTNANADCGGVAAQNPYCVNNYDLGKGRFLVTFSKTL